MQDYFYSKQFEFLSNTIHSFKKFNGNVFVISHVVSDTLPMFDCLATMADIACIVAIPYSTHQPTLEKLKECFEVLTPDLDKLLDQITLPNIVKKFCPSHIPTVLIEIGGYLAPHLQVLSSYFKENLLGIIEDTEAGHKRYLQQAVLPCPVISVARSRLKDNEDFLIGRSCLHATEKLFRSFNIPLVGRKALVLGYGKIGRGVAFALRSHDVHVDVYDTDPLCRLKALTEGFSIPDLDESLKTSRLIFGATGVCSLKGEKFSFLRKGAILVSCSSKQHEFDINYLQSHYHLKSDSIPISQFENDEGHSIYLINRGQPVNFMDGGVLVGPVIGLVHAEMLMAVNYLIENNLSKSVFQIDTKEKKYLADLWLDIFCDPQTGRYAYE